MYFQLYPLDISFSLHCERIIPADTFQYVYRPNDDDDDDDDVIQRKPEINSDALQALVIQVL